MKTLVFLRFLTLITAVFGQDLISNSQREIVLKAVNVIPMDQERVLENQTVVVNNGRITAMGKAGSVKFGKDALVIDATEKYLMPGWAELYLAGTEKLEQHLLAVFDPIQQIVQPVEFDFIHRLEQHPQFSGGKTLLHKPLQIINRQCADELPFVFAKGHLIRE